ncbi:hypothetical protein AKO1_007595 [Acrasis kona]|uniref:Major royal jelly protein n=1 Tax=Acrasis kona TaxID=1008807 RepID=A0AAW2YPZ0_9EUKA
MKTLCIFLAIICTFTHIVHSQLELVNSWKYLDFNFKSEQDRTKYINQQHYKNCFIAGIKLDSKGDIYVSVPRWKPNVPATLAKISNGQLHAFPSWDMNDVSNSTNGIRSVLGFEIDAKDRMWILDQGRVVDTPGNPTLTVWDLKTQHLVYRHVFDESIAPIETAFLNDIVVNADANIAYISDSGIPISGSKQSPRPGIISINIQSNKAKRHLDNHASTQANLEVWPVVNGKKCFRNEPMKTGADGIALSCDGNKLYWTPLTSRRLYGIKTSVLHSDDPEVEKNVVDLGDKSSISDGLIASNKGDMYITALEQNAIYHVSEKQIGPYVEQNAKGTEKLLSMSLLTNDTELLWPDTLALKDGYLYSTSNNLCSFLGGELDWNAQNFKIHKIKLVNSPNSYVFGCDMGATDDFRAVKIALICCAVSLFVLSMVIVVIIALRKTNKKTRYSEI